MSCSQCLNPAWTLGAEIGKKSCVSVQSRYKVVLGHRDTFFRPLRGIAQGDPIRVKTRSGSFQYTVDSIQVVPPDESLSFEQYISAKSLTLITCFPFDYIGPAPRRFVVRARMASKPAPPGLDPPVQATSAETGPLEKLQ